MNWGTELLKAPFPLDQLEFRVGATTKDKKRGMALAYAESRAYMDRLDKVFGVDGWNSRLMKMELVEIPGAQVSQWMAIVQVSAYTDTEKFNSVMREASGTDTDPMSAESRAFKRACTMLGIGRYLYASGQKWEEIRQVGRSYVFTDDAQARLLRDFETWQNEFFEKGQVQEPGTKPVPLDNAVNEELDFMGEDDPFADEDDDEDEGGPGETSEERKALYRKFRREIQGTFNGLGDLDKAKSWAVYQWTNKYTDDARTHSSEMTDEEIDKIMQSLRGNRPTWRKKYEKYLEKEKKG